ncbi:MAG: hypothetical protein K8S27_05590 [Candidatus Omnitrophica bacterium]|nr:hypothetical protein [Candidatus Omnitrophota bacterium]
MEIFQELTISDITKFKDSILDQNKLSPEWERNIERENQIKERDKGTEEVSDSIAYCFNYVGKELSKATLILRERDSSLIVSNIVPKDPGGLEKSEYNALLNNFVKNNLSGLSCEISKFDVTLNDLVGEKIAEKFYSFSGSANKSTGRSHPCDEERWFDFIFSALENDKHMIDIEAIRFFLIEDGWDGQAALDLSLDYENTYYIMKYVSKRTI